VDRRSALLALLTMPLGKFDAFKVRQMPSEPGVLIVPLDEWAGIDVTYRGQRVHFSAQQLFAILKDG